MSEISKARQRMFNKRDQTSEAGEGDAATQRYPRKFTVSSLTHRLEYRSSVPNIAPDSHRSKQGDLMPSEMPQTPSHSRSPFSYISRAKENTPLMMKTINIKIQQISQLNTPRHGSQADLEMESQFYQSPEKQCKAFHKFKPDLVMASLPERRHHSPFKPRECLKEWAEQTFAESRSSGRSFVDDLFPPARTIVFNRKILYQEEGLKFQRLSRIYNCNIKLVDSCEPTYLSLAKYTNPYLYSALTILAEEPSRVLTLFESQEANEDGAYHVCLCKDGVWRYILIDDFVPIKVISGIKHMLFVHSHQTEGTVELWPALVQKAVAKIYGTYLDLAMVREDGMSELFRLLTGAPVSSYPIKKDFRSYLILIDAALKRKHIVTLEEIDEEYQQTAGLKKIEIHQAYRVLQIKKSGLKIRNYGVPDLSTKLSFDECTIFNRIVIYRLESSYRYITHKLRHKRGFFSKLSITVPSRTRGYFDVWQNNPAYYKKHLGSNIDYQIAKVRMWLCRLEEDEIREGEWVELGREAELLEGQYELHVHLCQPKQYDFTLSYYGERQIEISRLKNMDLWPEPCCQSQN